MSKGYKSQLFHGIHILKKRRIWEERIWFFNKNVSSFSSRKPSIALLGVRGSRMIDGAKNKVSSFHKSTVTRHSQQKWKRNYLSTSETMLRAKNYEILMCGSRKKCQKPPFWTVFGQNGQNGENYQKSAWNIFLALTSPN